MPFFMRTSSNAYLLMPADEGQYGSIAPGKVADLFIVDGKPAERVADLRRVERVIRAGRVYESKALRAAVGGGQ